MKAAGSIHTVAVEVTGLLYRRLKRTWDALSILTVGAETGAEKGKRKRGAAPPGGRPNWNASQAYPPEGQGKLPQGRGNRPASQSNPPESRMGPPVGRVIPPAGGMTRQASGRPGPRAGRARPKAG